MTNKPNDSEDLPKIRAYGKDAAKQRKALDAEKVSAQARLEALEAEKASATKDSIVVSQARALGLSDAQLAWIQKTNSSAGWAELEEFSKLIGASPAPASQPSREPGRTSASRPEPSPPPQSFQPISGSHVPTVPFSSDDVRKALLRDDENALRQIAEAEKKQPGRLALKWGHLIPDEKPRW
jgi:hypothetical protein